MKICILMSTYNGEKYLREQLNSILKQKGEFDLDILIRDDGSKDSTLNILNEYANKFYNIKWYNGENLKTAQSFIDLIYKVSNEYDYYAFSDQDDYWEENKIKISVENLERYGEMPCIYFSNPELVDENLNTLNRKVYKKNIYNNFETTICGPNVIGCTMTFNKRLLNIIQNNEKPKIVTMHDSYLARVCTSIGGKIIYDNNSYLKYRQHFNNVIGVKNKFVDKVKDRIYDIFIKSNITIDEQANEILKIYENSIPEANKKFLKDVSKYRKNFILRLKLVFSKKTKYVSKNMSFKYRMSILLGNR